MVNRRSLRSVDTGMRDEESGMRAVVIVSSLDGDDELLFV